MSSRGLSTIIVLYRRSFFAGSHCLSGGDYCGFFPAFLELLVGVGSSTTKITLDIRHWEIPGRCNHLHKRRNTANVQDVSCDQV